LRRDFWWIWEADDEGRLRRWATGFCRRWQFWAPAMVQEFKAEIHRVLAYLRWAAAWRRWLRTANLAEGFFCHLRRYLGRFPPEPEPGDS
jgi:transposase-like protein